MSTFSGLRLDSAGRPDALGRALELAAYDVLHGGGEELDYTPYEDRPVEFIREVLGDQLWTQDEVEIVEEFEEEQRRALEDASDQASIARDLAAHRFIAVRASKGVGKTFLAARLVIWFLQTRPESMVVTTANTWTQVETQLWAEIRDAWANSQGPLRGEPMRTKWEPDAIRHPKWMALGVSPSREESQAGYHAKTHRDPKKRPAVLVVADEVSGIPDKRLDALRGLLTNPKSKLLWIANPTRLSGRFAEVWMPPMELPWETLDGDEQARRLEDPWEPRRHKINAFSAPAWVVEPDWIRMMRNTCGRQRHVYERNPVYICDVCGDFAQLDENKFFPLDMLEAAAWITPTLKDGSHIGVDVGRSHDPCVAVLVENGVVTSVKVWAGKMDSVHNVMRSAYVIRRLMMGDTWQNPDSEDRGWDVPARNVHIDASGGSMGVVLADKLEEIGLYVDRVDFGGSAVEDPQWSPIFRSPPRLTNRRQQLHWIAQQALAGGWVCIPKDPVFQPIWADLTEIEYATSASEGLMVESKQAFKKRTGRSSDYADAFFLALARTRPFFAGDTIRRLDTTGLRKVRLRARVRRRLA